METVTFTKGQWLPSTGRDGSDLAFEYSVVDSAYVGQPEETSMARHGVIVVTISRHLTVVWKLGEDALVKVLFEYAKRHIREEVFDGTLSTHEEIELTMSNCPKECPFDPSRIDMSFGKAYEFPVAKENPVVKADPSGLASQIIDLRDNINALYGEKFGGRLLNLPQERSLLELFRTCGSQEEFGYRVPSLCTLARSFEGKTIDEVGKFLRDKFPAEKVDLIMDVLQRFNRLRQNYPVHTDRADGVIAAYKHFGLEYPIEDYQAAWMKLLNAYLEVLKRILELLK
jgi:hypothetical protein